MTVTDNRVQHVTVPQASLDSVPRVAGQLIYTSDTLRTYWDISATERKLLSDMVILSTDDERKNILAPLDKFYFVEETNEFWRYTVEDGWIQLTSRSRVINCGGP